MGDSEISELRRLFERLDFNGDGVLTFDEIKAGIQKVSEHTEREVQAVLDGIDTDKSHSINYTEFLAAAITKAHYLKEEKLRQAFSIFDRDVDGRISISDLQETFGGKAPGTAYAETLVNEADLNKDGVVDYPEFVRMMEQD
eukprot:TRINITY_DN1358_c0_g1_i3.p1 TRINITY_DN1358_c0_g1~~TRINITY_DN1358_c0_g1_i3.p1  ORF type:complete len:142 (+),score=35.66 TRINITY_DN1358_c0_g1_i3:100-525(+)